MPRDHMLPKRITCRLILVCHAPPIWLNTCFLIFIEWLEQWQGTIRLEGFIFIINHWKTGQKIVVACPERVIYTFLCCHSRLGDIHLALATHISPWRHPVKKGYSVSRFPPWRDLACPASHDSAETWKQHFFSFQKPSNSMIQCIYQP
jgi:hypothetical protein